MSARRSEVTGPALVEWLHRLRWRNAAQALERQESQNDSRPFRERLSELLAAQEDGAGHRRQEAELKKAGLWGATETLSEVLYTPARQLNREAVQGLSDMGWIERRQNLIVQGATGTGKTWLATAFAVDAVRAGCRVRFFGLRRFIDSHAQAQHFGELTTWSKSVADADLLVLDGWGAVTLQQGDRDRLQELVEARERKASFLITSMLSVDEWATWLGGGPIAESIVDRLTGRAHRIKLHGPSLRGMATDTTESAGGEVDEQRSM